ncbi:MAG: bacillithiol biosynthesis BshC [Flavobacteriales bacterium]|nr:bacillithiol biosynthesis BshC [Flavobacteriales bacterium]
MCRSISTAPCGGEEARSCAHIFPDSFGRRARSDESLYQRIADDSVQVGPTFQRSVMSARTRAMQGLDHLEQRLVRSAKQAHAVAIGRYHKVREGVFPGGVLQERREGFLTVLADHGLGVMDELIGSLDPIEKRFSVFVPR